MTKHSNELVALEWLIDPLNQELDALHAYAEDSAPDLLIHYARGYQPLANVLLMANLPEFTKLAQTISKASSHFAIIKNPALLSSKIIYASHLLQHEINRYVNTGFVRRSLLNARIHYLDLVHAHFGGNTNETSVILQSIIDENFSDQLNFNVHAITPLDDKSYQEINQAWRVLAGQLIQSGVNGDQLNKLRNIGTHLAAATEEGTLQKLWLMAVLWLENVALNNEPLPHYYAHVLSELDRVIAFQKANIALELEANMWLESLIADMYVMLATLKIHNEAAQNFLKNLNDDLADDQSFFPHVLSTIDGIIFALADNKIDLHNLSALQEQLSVRGWSFYAHYVEQIISDAKMAQDDDALFAQVQWQLNTQLQDLHTAILSTAQTINAKENMYDTTRSTGERDVIGETRLLIESMKDAFALYVQTKNVDDLPKHKNFVSLGKSFEDMGLFDATTVISKMSEIFIKLEQQAPPYIHWQLAHKIAESLTLFETFLDNLTQQIFDHALLTRVDEHADESIELLHRLKTDGYELSDVDKERQAAHQYTIVYDDLGEHQPNTLLQTEAISSDLTSAYAISTNMDVNEHFAHLQNHSIRVQEEDSSLAENQLHITDIAHQEHLHDKPIDSHHDNVDAFIHKQSSESMTEFKQSDEHDDMQINQQMTVDDALTTESYTLLDVTDDDTIIDDMSQNNNDSKALSDFNSVDSDESQSSIQPDTWHSTSNTSNSSTDETLEFDDIRIDADVSTDEIIIIHETSDAAETQLDLTVDKSNDDVSCDKNTEIVLADTLSEDDLLRDDLQNHETLHAQDSQGLPVVTDQQNDEMDDQHLCDPDELIDAAIRDALIDDNLIDSDNINVNLSSEIDTEQDQLNVDELSKTTGHSDELYLSENLDDILLSDYINDGTVDNVIPNLETSPLLDSSPDSSSKTTSEMQTVLEAEARTDIDDTYVAVDVVKINEDEQMDDAASIHEMSEEKSDINTDHVVDIVDVDSIDITSETSSISHDNLKDDGDIKTSQESHTITDDDIKTLDFSEVYLIAKASLKEDDFSHDEEIREIFIEEAGEVMEEMSSYLPKWQTEPQNLKILKEIRRNWHTLKGSGRMVGALQLGETAWAIESLLNRVLDDTIKPSSDVVATVSAAADIIPVMVQDFANIQPPSVDNALVVMRANNLLAGRPMDEGAPSLAESHLTQMKSQQVLSKEELPLDSDKSTTDVFDGLDVDIHETNDIQADDTLLDHSQIEDDQIDSALTDDEVVAVVNENPIPDVLLPFFDAAKSVVHNPVQMDDDIREIYIEEAREVLADITPLFNEYQHNPNKALLTDVRRGFHTLKGSGRMVGASELGELAWSIENMLNRVLEDIIPMNAGMISLIHDILHEFDSLVSLFKAKSDEYPVKIQLWEACAHAYSKGHGQAFDYRQLGLSSTPVHQNELASDDDVIASPSETLHDPATQVNTQTTAKSTDESLARVEQTIGQIMSDATLTMPIDDEESQLCQIFIEEAQELLAHVTAFLDEHENDETTPVVDNSVVRAFHTLRGALGLPPLVSVGEVGETIENGLQYLQHHDMPLDSRHKQALKNSVILINSYLDDYNHGIIQGGHEQQNAEGNHDNRQEIEDIMSDGYDAYHTESLIEGIDDLLDAELKLEDISTQSDDAIHAYAKTQLAQTELLSSRTLDLPKFQSLLAALKSAYELLAEHAEQAKDDHFIDALLMVHHELIGLFDAMAGSMSLEVDKNALNRLNAITLERENYYQELNHDAKQQSKNQESSGDEGFTTKLSYDSSLVRLEAIDTDDELLEIFLEEALELDAKVATVFEQWREDKDNIDHLKTLQRHLHTIKGGARLAGIVSIGDLTHEAESVYERFTHKQMTVTDAWIHVMQRVQDVLSLQLESVKNTRQSFFADNTIADLQAYLLAGHIPEGASISTPLLETKVKISTTMPEEVDETITTTPSVDEKSQYEAFINESWQGVAPDEDILAVFLEESKELAESSSEDFAIFRNNTSDLTSLQSLQRKLHTIKGGARMISANGMADLAHEMETVYEDLGGRRLPATRMVTNLLFACHDWITAAIGLLENGFNPPRPTPLIEALNLFIKNPDSLNEVPMVSLEKEIDFMSEYQAFLVASGNTRDITHLPPMKGVFGQSVDSSNNNEMIRISAPLLERMINLSGEATINRTRIDMNLASITGSIEEMGITVQRLFDQLRRMDIELEEQILSQIDNASLDEGFDPLEMDQYSSLNQLSKSLSESASDLLDIKATMLDKTRDGENLLLQLSRTQTDLQDSLMSSRMVPFSRLTPRLQRIVRQTASELGKNVDLKVINADDQMDRNILDRITSPLEHMLRNAVDHGIETPNRRAELGKPFVGHITLEVLREGGEMVIILSDDGAGVNVEVVRKKAISQGLIHPDEQLSNNDIMQYIFNAGLSTTNKITQISGRGVGMDVVRTEIRELGGSVSVESEPNQGSRFIIRVPLTVAVSDVLIVRVADRQYAVPLTQIERVAQVNAVTLLDYHQSEEGTIKIDNKNYRLRYLNEILTGHYFNEIISGASLPVIIIKTQTGQALALQVDEIVGSRIEIVVKPLGRQLSHLSGISAATIMGDGSVMLILDLLALMRTAQTKRTVQEVKPIISRRLIMVVDDSVTVRKVTSRFLEREGFEVIVAKDGMDAIEILQDTLPDLMLLDIEMPRMDGFEVATQVRHSPRLRQLPIIMMTSRTGEKHRKHAFEIGVNEYMGKPFQEAELLTRINDLLAVNVAKT